MSKVEILKDVLIEELKDLYSAEHQLLKALPKMEKKASNESLKTLFNSHLKETEGQIKKLDQISNFLKEEFAGKVCKAMQGLIEEGKEILEEESDNEALIDTMLIGAARRVEHYEIAAYNTVSAIAKELGEEKVVKLLNEILSEEESADKKLSTLLNNTILSQANMDLPEQIPYKNESIVKTVPGMIALIGFFMAVSFQYSSSTFLMAEAQSVVVKNEKESANYTADNTGKNIRDRNEHRKTADDQKASGQEVEVLARIRQDIVANKDLSVNGKNVKIVVDSGTVTLRGPVASNTEKSWIDATATRCAPGFIVVNQLEVVAN